MILLVAVALALFPASLEADGGASLLLMMQRQARMKPVVLTPPPATFGGMPDGSSFTCWPPAGPVLRFCVVYTTERR